MSVNNVNSIYQTQGMTGAQSGTPIVQIEENETNIGAWLLGGAAVIATGAAICAGKGQSVSGDQGFLENICNGFKSWFGKNGDEVAEAAGNAVTKSADSLDDGTLKLLKRAANDGNSLTTAEKDSLFANREAISEYINNHKVQNNTEKLNIVESLKNKGTTYDEEYVKQLNKLICKKDARIFELDGGTIKVCDNADETLLAKAKNLGIQVNKDNTITNKINFNTLKDKYTAKHDGYQTFASCIQQSKSSNDMFNIFTKNVYRDSSNNICFDNTPGNTIAANTSRLFNKTLELTPKSKGAYSVDDYLSDIARAKKYNGAKQITDEELDNFTALAEHKLAENNTDYLTYITRDLKYKDGTKINLTKHITEAQLKELNNLLSLNIKSMPKKIKSKTNEKFYSISASDILKAKKASTNNIVSYLGLSGNSVPNGWTITNNGKRLEYKGTKQLSSNPFSSSLIKLEAYEVKVGETFTGYQIDLDKLKKIKH